MSDDPKNKRRYPRLNADQITSIRAKAKSKQDSHRSAEAKVRDLSLAGAFIETDVTYEVGDFVEFEIKADGQTNTVPALVRWVKEAEPRGIGVEFYQDLRGW